MAEASSVVVVVVVVVVNMLNVKVIIASKMMNHTARALYK